VARAPYAVQACPIASYALVFDTVLAFHSEISENNASKVFPTWVEVERFFKFGSDNLSPTTGASTLLIYEFAVVFVSNKYIGKLFYIFLTFSLVFSQHHHKPNYFNC